jgi:hypothetical protein
LYGFSLGLSDLRAASVNIDLLPLKYRQGVSPNALAQSPVISMHWIIKKYRQNSSNPDGIGKNGFGNENAHRPSVRQMQSLRADSSRRMPSFF